MTDYLVIPRVVGPVSVGSRFLRVTGHVKRAVVAVTAIAPNGTERTVARDVPGSPGDGLLPVLPYITLAAGERLYAAQSTSPKPNRESQRGAGETGPVVLGPPRGELGGLAVLTHPYECAACAYVEGAFPGAQVTVLSGGSSIGSAEAIGTFARPDLLRPLALGASVGFQQTVLVWSSTVTAWGPAEPAPLDPLSPAVERRPPPVELRSGVFECSAGVLLAGLLGGATVEVERRTSNQVFAVSERSSVDLDSVWWPTPNMQKGETFRARQIVCKERASRWSELLVAGETPLSTPWLETPCGQETSVRVHGLTPGSTVTLTVIRNPDALPLIDTFTGEAASSTVLFELSRKPFPVGTKISVEATLCGRTARGRSVVVRPAQYTRPREPSFVLPPPRPTIVGPLSSCASRVRVKGVPVGSFVSIISNRYALANVPGSGCISPEVYVAGPKGQVDVPVVALEAGDQLWAVARVCGKLYTSEPAELVRPLGDVPRPEVLPVKTCSPIVVRNLVPGAVVEVYVNDVFVPPALPVPATSNVFHRPEKLSVLDSVRVRQRICEQQRDSLPTTVLTGSFVVAKTAVRLQQLTGNVDPDPLYPSGAPRAEPNRTFLNFDLPGMDLGVPVEHEGELYLFFGDSRTHAHTHPDWRLDQSGVGTGPFIRPIARVVDLPDDPAKGLLLEYLTNPDGSVHSLTISDPTNPVPRTTDEPFFVPSGGFSWNGDIYLFVMQTVLRPEWGPPRGFPTSDEADSWQREHYALTFGATDVQLVGGRSLMCRASNPLATFEAIPIVDVRSFSSGDAPGRWKFAQICPLVAKADTVPSLGATGSVLLLWGTGAYRQSDVCFAWTQLEEGQQAPGPERWNYLAGFAATPVFSVEMKAAVGLLSGSGTNSSVLYPDRAPFTSLGEFSVVYIPEARRWLMLITPDMQDRQSRVCALSASEPWGPWAPLPAPGAVPGLEILNVSALPQAIAKTGIYAPYVLRGLTEWRAEENAFRVVFVASFLDGGDPRAPPPEEHGQVHLYEVHLRCE